MHYVDPQNGQLDVSDYFAKGKKPAFGILRIDDKEINPDKTLVFSAVEVKNN